MAYLKYGLTSEGDGTVTAFTDPSYTIRAFNTYLDDFKVSKYDEQYHTYYQRDAQGKWSESYSYYFGASVPNQGTVFVKNQENWVYPSIDQGTVNTYTQSTLDQLNQLQLETGIPVNDNANGNYDQGISVPVNGTITFESSVNDNLLQGEFSNAGTYYIQMALWNFPGTADAGKLNLAQSSITFSSSINYDPAQSVTIPFNSSELEIPLDDPAEQDTIWKINRDVLVNQSIPSSGSVDLSNLKRIKFNLVNSGSQFVFKATQMKMVKSTYSHNYANVNTKTGVLQRETWPTISQNHMPVLIQNGLTVKDFTYISKFSFRSLPVSGTTELSMFGRIMPTFTFGTAGTATSSITYPSGTAYPSVTLYPVVGADTNAYLRSKLLIDSNSVQIKMYEDHFTNLDNEIFNIEFNQPITAGDYFFVTKFEGNKWESILYSTEEGADYPKDIVLETGRQTILNPWLRGDISSPYEKETGRGYAGYQFKPDEVGGFSMDYIYSKNAVLAEYESKTFNSYTPVKAISIFPSSVPDIDLLSSGITDFIRVRNTNNFNKSGKREVGFVAEPQNADVDDVVVVEDTEIYYSSKSLKVIKKEDAKIAAVQYRSKIKINDFSKLIFKTKIKFNNLLNKGDFRIVFWDESRTKVLYVQKITGIVPDRWNDVEFPLSSTTLFNNQFIMEIGHYGQIDPIPPITEPYGQFWLEETRLTLEALEWEVSNNDGKTYVPVLDAINGEYKSVNFASQNYYTSIINKNPYILWEFNTPQASFIVSDDNRNSTLGEFTTTSGGELSDYTISTPGTVTSNGTAYTVPASVEKFLNNKAIAVYGGTDSYITTANNQTLASVFGISSGSASNITASIRFYSDTTGNKINLLSCEDGPGTVTNSWNLSINNTTDFIFESNGVGTVTATVNNWNDNKWHTACFAYSTIDNSLRLYWDGELVEKTNLASDLIFNYPLKSTGPTATVPHNTYDDFNSSRPFIFIDNISVHKEVLDQNEIYKDYIAAISSYNKLKVRARAYTTNAWLVGYELIPHYAKMGRLKENVNKAITKTDSFTATEYSPQQDGIIFDQAIFDVSTFGND